MIVVFKKKEKEKRKERRYSPLLSSYDFLKMFFLKIF